MLLVGDAAGYVDALTGEGIALGMATARAAIACIVSGRPDRYEQQWRAATRRYRALTRGVLFAAAALPPVFRAAVRALA